MAKILFFGDIMAKPGRQALAQVLPGLKEEYDPDLVVANVENLAHGKGVTSGTLDELSRLGVDVFTSGNHVFDKGVTSAECFDKYPNLIRPANYSVLPSFEGEPSGPVPGTGWYRTSKNGQQYLFINLGGRVFFENQFKAPIDNPFTILDRILENESQKGDIIVVDFHAEATSEKVALGWYADGRVSAMLGTHTHIPTADARVLPKGTAYVTDVGMTGPLESVIGVKVETVVNSFLEKDRFRMDIPESGPAVVNAAIIEFENDKAVKIQTINKQI
jgi:metallophosphoesterase (TIGR00282 family)